METDIDNQLKELHKSLNNQLNPEKFGLRSDYIFSHIILKLQFDLFVRKDNIGIKSPKANLDKTEIEYLTRLIQKIDGNFQYRNYGGEKNIYSIWELSVANYTDLEIGNLINSIKKKLF